MPTEEQIERAARSKWNTDSARSMSLVWDEVTQDNEDYALKDIYRDLARAILVGVEAVLGHARVVELSAPEGPNAAYALILVPCDASMLHMGPVDAGELVAAVREGHKS